MKTLCGLLTVLLILGPVGMGMMLAIDAPQSEDVISTIDENNPTRFDDHGTRSHPEEGPTFLNFYLQRSTDLPGVDGPVINTTNMNRGNPANINTATTFNLEESLHTDLWVTDPIGEPGMRAVVHLSSTAGAQITITVNDNEGGTQVGYVEYTLPTLPLSPVTIDIPFDPAHNNNYTFSAGHRISVEFTFSGTVYMVYDSASQPGYIRFNCEPVQDIEIMTKNYQNEDTKTFYPNNIDFPVDRRVVNIEGEITDAFRKWDKKYIQGVEVELKRGTSTVLTDNASINRDTWIYSYKWEYNEGIADGEYTIIVRVSDEQDNEFTVRNTFNMSTYGILLTSPYQAGGEGSFTSQGAVAERKVVLYTNTTYWINVVNIGNADTTVDIAVTGPPPEDDWDWGLEGPNLTKNDGSKVDDVAGVSPGWEHRQGIKLIVYPQGNAVDQTTTITVTATCSEDPGEGSILQTKTRVVVKYDVRMKFTDNTKSQEQTVELGDEAIYEFKVTNIGGANDTIYITLGSLPTGWTESLTGADLQTNHPDYGKYYVNLASDDTSEDITLTLGTTSTGGDLVAEIKITARSWGSKEQNDDPIVSDEITTTTTLTTGIMLEVVSSPEKETDPDEAVNFELRLTNPGSTQADYTVYLTLLGDSNGWEDGDISFESGPNVDEKQYTLGAGDSSSFFVWAEPTVDVLAKNYSIQVHAERDDDPTVRYAEKTVYVIVREFHNIVVTSSLELDEKAEPGDDVQYKITLENRGNVAEWVTILVTVPKDWTVDFGNASSEWSKEVQPGDMEEVTVILGIPEDAEGDETVDVTISVVPASSDPVQVLTHTKINAVWYQPIFMLLVPIGLFLAIIVLVVVIFRRR